MVFSFQFKKLIIIRSEHKNGQNNKGWSDIIMKIHRATTSTHLKDL